MSSDAPAFAILLIIGLAAFALRVWAIVDVVKVPDDSVSRRGPSWCGSLVIGITGVIGAIIYLLVGRPAPATEAARSHLRRINRHLRRPGRSGNDLGGGCGFAAFV